MSIMGVMVNELMDYLKYGENGNPAYESENNIQKFVRGMDRVGLYGMGGALFDGIKHGSYSGIVKSTIGIPSLTVWEDAAKTTLGTVRWDSKQLADGIDAYIAAVLINLPRMGVDVDQESKAEIKEFLQYFFEDYLGMEAGGAYSTTFDE